LSEDRILFCKGQAWPPNIPELNEVSLPDRVETALTTDFRIYKYDPDLSPVAPVVIYTGYVSGEGGGILARSLYRFELATRRSVRLTENEHWDDVTPSWSPDGSRVLFASNRNGHFEIWWLEPGSLRTGQVTRATEPGVEHFNPGLSPDGSQLACFRTHGRETLLELRPASALPW
jgi:dipeptidyl aminopeptidase/acylaminoacyl peptidase